MKSYTVLLLYPDYLAESFGHETYLAHVEARSLRAAIKLAQLQARRAQGYVYDESQSSEDFACLLVIKGHHDDIKP